MIVIQRILQSKEASYYKTSWTGSDGRERHFVILFISEDTDSTKNNEPLTIVNGSLLTITIPH